MSYNPQINFRLRDDEVVIGNLIVGKEIVPDIETLLISIRNGVPVNTSAYQQLFSNYIFSDEEFTAIKEEYEQIKIDYKFFSSVMYSKLKVTSAAKNTGAKFGATLEYVVGSATWIETYIKIKNLAGEMFRTLQQMAYDFEGKEPEYEQRYHEITVEDTNNGVLVEQYVDMYKQGVMDGDDSVKATVLGLMNGLPDITKARIEGQIKLWEVSAGVSTKQVVRKAGTDALIDVNEKEEPEEVLIPITANMLVNRARMICDLKSYEHIYMGLKELNAYAAQMCAECDIVFPEQQQKDIESSKLDLGQIVQTEKVIINTLDYSANAVLLDALGWSMTKDRWDTFCLPQGVKASSGIAVYIENVLPEEAKEATESKSEVEETKEPEKPFAEAVKETVNKLNNIRDINAKTEKFDELANHIIKKQQKCGAMRASANDEYTNKRAELKNSGDYNAICENHKKFIIDTINSGICNNMVADEGDIKLLNQIVFV